MMSLICELRLAVRAQRKKLAADRAVVHSETPQDMAERTTRALDRYAELVCCLSEVVRILDTHQEAEQLVRSSKLDALQKHVDNLQARLGRRRDRCHRALDRVLKIAKGRKDTILTQRDTINRLADQNDQLKRKLAIREFRAGR